jgi:hypothetical protein
MAMLPPGFKAASVSRVRLAWTAACGEECTLSQKNRAVELARIRRGL